MIFRLDGSPGNQFQCDIVLGSLKIVRLFVLLPQASSHVRLKRFSQKCIGQSYLLILYSAHSTNRRQLALQGCIFETTFLHLKLFFLFWIFFLRLWNHFYFLNWCIIVCCLFCSGYNVRIDFEWSILVPFMHIILQLVIVYITKALWNKAIILRCHRKAQSRRYDYVGASGDKPSV